MMYLPYAAILFWDKNEKEITDEDRRKKVVESHKIAKKMLECACRLDSRGMYTAKI